MSIKASTATVQKWGNSLAIRIPASIARKVHFDIGTPVEIAIHEGEISVRTLGEKRLTLDERLDLFDPDKHGGEIISSGRVGQEKF